MSEAPPTSTTSSDRDGAISHVAEMARQAVDRMPTHGDFIDTHCLARTPAPV